ncbi:MAG: uracil-DNA glycosylase [Fimbriiglobus sp.]
MSDDPKHRAARQVKRHLDALRAAGVDFVPANPPPLFPHLPENPAVPPTLFAEAAPVPPNPDGRRIELDQLAAVVATCDQCPELFSTRTQTVFGTGQLSPDICFVGEAPGADEDRAGFPFVGKSGELLTKIIAAMGLSRDEVYICNTIKCRPPQNRNPTPVECANCRGFFERQIELVAPKYLCCLGAVAAQNVLSTKTPISKLRGSFQKYQGIPVLCTFHPAYLLRDPSKKKECWEDMKMLLTALGRPIPGPGG